MTVVKTSELIGAALDWAVAKCEEAKYGDVGLSYIQKYDSVDGPVYGVREKNSFEMEPSFTYSREYIPSREWAQGGLISERARISARPVSTPTGTEDAVILVQGWCAEKFVTVHGPVKMFGETELIAKMRCYVASEVGQKVDVPEVFTVDGINLKA